MDYLPTVPRSSWRSHTQPDHCCGWLGLERCSDSQWVSPPSLKNTPRCAPCSPTLTLKLKSGTLIEANLDPSIRNIRNLEKANFLGAWIAINAMRTQASAQTIPAIAPITANILSTTSTLTQSASPAPTLGWDCGYPDPYPWVVSGTLPGNSFPRMRITTKCNLNGLTGQLHCLLHVLKRCEME